jgi:hypothetical protein
MIAFINKYKYQQCLYASKSNIKYHFFSNIKKKKRKTPKRKFIQISRNKTTFRVLLSHLHTIIWKFILLQTIMSFEYNDNNIILTFSHLFYRKFSHIYIRHQTLFIRNRKSLCLFKENGVR